jgi:penicillin-binding protein 2
VVVAFFEHGEHGHFAAPIVRDVIKAYFDKKARLATLQQLKQSMETRASLGLPNRGTGNTAPAALSTAPPSSVEVAYFESSSSAPAQTPSVASTAPRPPR